MSKEDVRLLGNDHTFAVKLKEGYWKIGKDIYAGQIGSIRTE